jgi:dipeptidase D
MDIHLGKGNANIILNRFVYATQDAHDVRIAEIDGGGLRNAIPREAIATLAVADAAGFEKAVNNLAIQIKAELGGSDPNFAVELTAIDTPTQVISKVDQSALVRTIYTIPNNVWRMSTEMENLTETSSNLARVLVQNGEMSLETLQRSSVESQKNDIANAVRCAMENMGAEVTHSGSYPGWTPRPDAAIVTIMRDLYVDMYGEQPHVNACHAGLECGILGTNYPDMEMISFGPTIKGAHSPDERVKIESVQKFWNYLLATLKAIPTK